MSNLVKSRNITYSGQGITLTVARHQLGTSNTNAAQDTTYEQMQAMQNNLRRRESVEEQKVQEAKMPGYEQMQAMQKALRQRTLEEERTIIERAETEARGIILKAHQEAQEIKRTAELEVQKMYQAAYQQGKQQAEEECAKFVQEAKSLVANAVKQKQEMLDSIDQDVLNLISQVVNKFMDNKLKTDEYTRASIFKHAVTELLKRDEHIRKVRVSKDLFNVGSIRELGVEVVLDNGLKKDECIIETEHGEVDGSISSQRAKVEKALSQVAG